MASPAQLREAPPPSAEQVLADEFENRQRLLARVRATLHDSRDLLAWLDEVLRQTDHILGHKAAGRG